MKALGEESAALNQKFSENLLDATNAFAEDIEDEALLEGIPEDVKTMYASLAEAAAKRGGVSRCSIRATSPPCSTRPIVSYVRSSIMHS